MTVTAIAIMDAAICEVAKRASHTLRKSDTIARLGGDEFGVILQPTNGILFLAESIERPPESNLPAIPIRITSAIRRQHWCFSRCLRPDFNVLSLVTKLCIRINVERVI